MAGYLPDGVSQGDIDRALGGTHAEWQCEDPECKTLWEKMPETWPCDHEGCEIVCCEECYAKCFSCSKSLCSTHRQKADVGDGQQFYCSQCIADAKEQEGLSGAA